MHDVPKPVPIIVIGSTTISNLVAQPKPAAKPVISLKSFVSPKPMVATAVGPTIASVSIVQSKSVVLSRPVILPVPIISSKPLILANNDDDDIVDLTMMTTIVTPLTARYVISVKPAAKCSAKQLLIEFDSEPLIDNSSLKKKQKPRRSKYF